MDYRWLSLGVGLWLGCAPQVDGGAGDAGSESAPSTGEGTSSTGGGSSITAQSEDSGMPPSVCESFADDALPPEGGATLEFRNTSATSILLQTNCGLDYIAVENPAGWRWPGGFCADTCEGQFEFGCSACEGCAEGSFRVLGPGASIELGWSGELYETANPPQSCVGEYPLCGRGSCPVLRAASEGEEITIRIAAAWQADCEEAALDPSFCSCPEGMTCDVYVDAEGLGPTTAFEVTAVVDGETIVVEAPGE